MSQATREAADKFAALKGSEVFGYAERDGAVIIVLRSGHKFIFTPEQLAKTIAALEEGAPAPKSPGVTVGDHPKKKGK